MSHKRISIIIPALNEENYLEHTCLQIRQFRAQIEIIIVDGGSTDLTTTIGSRFGRVVNSPPGRAIQMNTGASRATGDILWFVHADCIPHPEASTAIQATMSDGEFVGGAFEYFLDAAGMIYRLSEFLSNLKNRSLKLMYGDMGIFVRADVFRELGGFKEIPVMEDLDFGQRLKTIGRISILPYPMCTSARRWQQEGPLKNFARNWLLQMGWAFGISPEYLGKWYSYNNKNEIRQNRKI